MIQINKYGVVEEPEKFLTLSAGRVKAELFVAEIEPGVWVAARHIQGPTSGSSEPVSIRGIRYESRDEAVRGVTKRLIEYCAQQDLSYRENERTDYQKLVEKLEESLVPQLALL